MRKRWSRTNLGVWQLLFLYPLGCSYDVVFHRKTLTVESTGGSLGLGGVGGQPRGGASSNPGVGGSAGGSGGGVGSTPARLPLTPGVSWQWQVTGDVDTTISALVYIVDLFDVSIDAIRRLKTNGKTVICEFSAGTSEPWRSDVAELPAEVLGNSSEAEPDETWLDVQASAVRQLMAARMDRAVERGCDGVLPDSVDGYGADTGFALTADQSLGYLGFLAGEAKKRSLWVGLANCAEIVSSAEPLFDFSVQSRCLRYGECSAFKPFLNATKPVLHAEIVSDMADGQTRLSGICEDTHRQGFSTILKLSTLDGWRLSCE